MKRIKPDFDDTEFPWLNPDHIFWKIGTDNFTTPLLVGFLAGVYKTKPRKKRTVRKKNGIKK